MNKSKYLQSIVLLMSLFSAPLFAADMFVERLNEKLHFVIYPTDNQLNYYVLWFPFTTTCSKINDGRPLLLESGNVYRNPENGGYLCIIRSEKLLDEKWAIYQIKPENSLLFFIDKGVNPGHVPDSAHELSFKLLDCSFTVEGSFKQCKFQL